MDKNSAIVIEKTSNGYVVRAEYRPDHLISIADFAVFQDMGYASSARDNQKTEDTLLGFIAAHFTENVS